uniref:Cytokine like 1 n=1 Tax=Sus scrofa TaxID=9823 RepID=A0A8D1UU28_PIG
MCILYLYIYLYGIYRTVPQLIVKWKDCFLHVYSRRAVCHFGRKVAFGIKSTMHVGIKESPRDPGLVWLLDGWPRTSGEQPEDTSLRASHDRCSFLQEPCVRYLPRLYLDIHNYCVLDKLRDFVASPQCWRVAQVDALKDKVRKLYTIMNSFCRRDLVFLSDDCNALEYPIPVTTVRPDPQRRDPAAQTRDRTRGH